MASVQTEKIKEFLPNAKFLPPQYSHHIIDLIDNKKTVFNEENKTVFPKKYSDIIAPISISEGCMFNCSYCITTLARGNLRSFPISEIKKDVCFAVKNGCKEIQITSQDTSSYGIDRKKNLGKLLDEITKVEGDYKIRVGMMNPYTCKKNLEQIINGFKDSEIYKFVHLPVQSGDNEILEKMNRKYKVSDFIKIVETFRKNYPDITIATDIIVGFPTETEEQFKKTVDLLKKVKPDITNITRFSARPKTLAKKMKGRIKTETVKDRSKRLTEIVKDISCDNNKKHIGKKCNVLITKKGKEGSFVGRNEFYKPVVVKENVEIGDFYKVKIIDYGSTYLVGSII